MEQRQYQKLEEYKDRLKAYAKHIEVCGEQRNSYSKTDHSATFMRVKSDYMGNGQLLPAYNLQAAICDEYIACLLYTSPSPRDQRGSRMPSSA